MRIELSTRGFDVTTPAPDATAEARTPSRGDALRALVRTHQRLIEARVRLEQGGARVDPQIERDLAAITERVRILLSGPGPLAANAERMPVHLRGEEDVGTARRRPQGA